MVRIGVLSMNVFRGLLSKRALYVWAAAVVLMLLRSGPAIFLTTNDPQAVAFFRANAISGALDTWALLALAAAIFLGAASVGGEKTNKTISTVLARPLHRWEFLVGHWLGVVVFSVVSLAIGLVFAAGLAWYMGIAIDTGRASIALAATLAGVAMFAATGIALGANSSVALAAVITVLLAFLPPLVTILRTDAKPWQHYSGVALDYLTPPGYTSHYQGVTWSQPPTLRGMRANARQMQRPVVDYPEARKTLLTQIGYGAAYFLIGGLVFLRRDIKLG
jgi:ABC-type transport system involved in multi-copper enzyme maturation permease subunit